MPRHDVTGWASPRNTLYGDEPPPQLTMAVADGIVLDWVTEAVLLQVVEAALDNVYRHSQARHVTIAVEPVDDSAVLTVTDDGVGYDPTAGPTTDTAFATMRAALAAVDGHLAVDSHPGAGTTITARLGPPPPAPDTTPAPRLPRLRLVPRPAD